MINVSINATKNNKNIRNMAEKNLPAIFFQRDF